MKTWVVVGKTWVVAKKTRSLVISARVVGGGTWGGIGAMRDGQVISNR